MVGNMEDEAGITCVTRSLQDLKTRPKSQEGSYLQK